jgi:pheromone a factor receptor
MTRIELPVLSFLAVLSLLFILPLHLKSRNIPFLFLIAWLLVCNIIQGVDAIVWANNALIRAEGWCDLGEQLFESR